MSIKSIRKIAREIGVTAAQVSVVASEIEVVRAMLDIASNAMSEHELTVWLEQPEVANG